MIVIGTILILTIFFVVIPKKASVYYMLICGLVLSLLCMAIIPTEDYDLFRHYQIQDLLKGIEFKNLFSKYEPPYWTYTVYLFEKYQTSSPAYLVFAKIISTIGKKEWLVFCVSIISYGVIIYIIAKEQKRHGLSKSIVGFCFFFFLACFNFIEITGIRMVLSFSIFILGLYREIVEKKNPFISYLLYVVAALIHGMTWIYIAIRITIIISNKILKKICGICLVISIIFIPTLYSLGYRLPESNFLFTAFNALCKQLYEFVMTDNSGSVTSSISTRFMIGTVGVRLLIILSCFFIYLFWRNIHLNSKYERMLNMLYWFTIATTVQYDVFIRNYLMVLACTMIILPEVMGRIIGKNLLEVRCERKSQYLYLSLLMVIGVAFVGFYLTSYRALDEVIVLWG